MRKVTILAAAIAFFGLVSVDATAQTTQETTPQTETSAQEENKEKITKDQLPQPIQEVLSNEAYQAWTVSEVYKVAAGTEAEAKPTYEVYFTNAEDKRAIARFNEDGTPIKTEE